MDQRGQRASRRIEGRYNEVATRRLQERFSGDIFKNPARVLRGGFECAGAGGRRRVGRPGGSWAVGGRSVSLQRESEPGAVRLQLRVQIRSWHISDEAGGLRSKPARSIGKPDYCKCMRRLQKL